MFATRQPSMASISPSSSPQSSIEPLIYLDRPKYICAGCSCDLALQVGVTSRVSPHDPRSRLTDALYHSWETQYIDYRMSSCRERSLGGLDRLSCSDRRELISLVYRQLNPKGLIADLPILPSIVQRLKLNPRTSLSCAITLVSTPLPYLPPQRQCQARKERSQDAPHWNAHNQQHNVQRMRSASRLGIHQSQRPGSKIQRG